MGRVEATNQRLLSQLREAETKREEMVKAAQEEQLGKLQRELEGATSEVDSLRKHRQSQETVINRLVAQREEMKALYLAERDKKGDAAAPATPAVPADDTNPTVQATTDLNDPQNMVSYPHPSRVECCTFPLGRWPAWRRSCRS